MKVAVVLLSLLVVATAAPEKRFIWSNPFPDFMDAINRWFTNTFNKAKDDFNNLIGSIDIDFDDVVEKLVPLIDSEMSQATCTTTCIGASFVVLGPAAILAGTACKPVCKAALAKLE